MVRDVTFENYQRCLRHGDVLLFGNNAIAVEEDASYVGGLKAGGCSILSILENFPDVQFMTHESAFRL